MQIDRKKLLDAVETVKPALATKELIEELVHVWLDGDTITAYNDASLGIQVPFESELKGGIRGSILLGVLGHSRADDIEVEIPTEGEALLRAGRTKLKLALLPSDRAIWSLPELGKAKGFRVHKPVIEALKMALISIGSSSSVPEQMGITCLMQGALQFYALDGRTIAWATVKEVEGWPIKAGERVILPTDFVEQLIKLHDEKTSIYFVEGGVVAINNDGVKLFARLIDVQKPTDFRKIIDDANKGAQMFSIPARLKLALARAEVMLSGQDEPMDVTIDDGEMRLQASMPFGELKETIKLDDHPKSVSLRLNPALMQRALELCSRIGFSEQTSVMQGKNFLYLIANFHKPRSKDE